MSTAEADKFQELLTQWWGRKSARFLGAIISATVACVMAVAGSTWKVSAELHQIHMAIERNGLSDDIMRAELVRLETRVNALELRTIKP